MRLTLQSVGTTYYYSNNLLDSYLKEYSSCDISQGLVTEFARFCRVFTPPLGHASVKEFAGKTFVKVEALLPLGATLQHVKLAQFHHFGWFNLV